MTTHPTPLHAAPTNRPPLRQISQLPGPIAWPLIGNLLQMRPRHLHLDVERWSRRYGPLFRFHIARTPIVVVADHQLVADVLRDRPEGFRRPSVTAAVSAELGGDPGLFLAEGNDWRAQRRLLMPAFSSQAIKAYFPLLIRVMGRLQTRWTVAAQARQPIDLTADLKRYSADIITGLAFGADVNSLESGDTALQHHIDVALSETARRSAIPFPYWRYFKLPIDRRAERAVAALRTTVDETIRQARARMQAEPARYTAPQNLLEAMLAAATQPDNPVTDEGVSGNVSTMLIAGEDTTANSLAWVLYLLAKHPAALAQARAEVRRLAPDAAAFSMEQMDALVYLDACAQEAMRLKPVAPFIPLEALRDTVVGDVLVPKGCLVWCVMRRDSVDERHFPQAEHFDPARWLPQTDGTTAANKGAVLPFGAGPRTCPGRYLALLEIKLALAMLLAVFELDGVDTQDGQPTVENMGFVMSPVGLRMHLRLR